MPVTVGCAGVTPVELPVVHITWAAHTLGGSFLRYEVERRDQRDPTWRLIATITDPATTEVWDHEARMGGVETTYRVRQVRDDGVTSDWTLTAAVPVETPDECRAALVMSTNTDGSRAVAVPDLTEASKPAPRDYSPQAPDQVTTSGIYGRDGLVAFRELEWRGVTFGRTLMVDALMAGRPSGLIVFDPLRDLTEDPALPYVCVRDSFGDRWLALVSPDKLGIYKGDRHRADVEVTELTRDPHPITAWNGSLGPPWELLGAGRWGTSAGSALLRGHSGAASLAVQDIGLTNAAVRAKIAGTVVAGSGAAFRVVDASTFVAVEITGTGWSLVKVVSGVATTIAGAVGGPSGTVVEARFSGSSSTGGLVVTVFLNGVRQGAWTITDPEFDGATCAGLSYRGGTAAPTTRWDEWEVWDPAETPGAPWTAHTGTWRAEGSDLSPFATDLAGTGRNVLTADASTPDGQVHAVLDAQDSTALILRYIDASNHLALRANRTAGTWTLAQRIAGVTTDLATTAATAAGDNVDVLAQVRGDTFRLRVNGVWTALGGAMTVTLPAAVAPLAAATRHGVGHLAAFPAAASGVKVHAAQVDPVTNLGRDGAVLATGPAAVGTGRWVDAMRLVPQLDSDDLAVALWGRDDALLGTGPALTAWRHALRSVASWWLRSEDHQHTDPSITYSGFGWTTVAATDRNTGTGYRSGVHTASASIAIPGGYTGGRIALRFLGGGDAGGGASTGTAQVSIDGGSASSWPTNIWTAVGAHVTMTTLRLPPLTPGAHTIQVVVDGSVGAVLFDGWHIEHVNPAARVRLGTVPRTPGGAPSDATVAAYNTAVAEVAAEFGTAVQSLDVDAALAANPALFAGAGLYPNDAGARAIAAAAVESLVGWRPAHLWIAGNGAAAGVGAPAARGTDDALRRALTTPPVLDGFDRPAVARHRDDFTR